MKLLAPWRGLSKHASRPWYPVVFYTLFFLSILGLGAAAGLVIVSPWKSKSEAQPTILVDTVRVPTDASRPPALVAYARNRLGSVVTLKGPSFTHSLKWIDLGATVDFEMLDRILAGYRSAETPTAKHFSSRDKEGLPRVPLPISLDAEQAVEALVSLKELINRAPQKATFDFSQNGVVEEQDGLVLDVYGTLDRLDKALRDDSSEVEMVIESVKADVTREDLSNIAADDVMGFFETPYSRMRKDQHRTHNVKLGAKMLTGQVIMPGKVFSFNDTLGPRSEARGFRYAPVIAGGVLVEGMGGGTCQVASTLNAAAFFAGLVVVDRRVHSRPSSYIKLGLDATVSYPDIDLKLKNPLDHPVIVRFTADDGKLRAEIRGEERSFTTTFLRKISKATPFPIRVIESSKVERGKEVITQLGIPGYTVRRYQIIEKDKVAYRFQTVDKYPPTVQFVHKGIGDPAAVKEVEDPPKPDTHNPYRAAPYLRMVQGKDGLWYEQSHD